MSFRKMELNGMSSTVPRGKANPLYESKESLDTPWYRPQSTPRLVKSKQHNRGPAVFVILAIICDILVLLFVVVFEYFLRCSSTWFHQHRDVQSLCRHLWTSTFPVRQRIFTCSDVTIKANSSYVPDFEQFPFQAHVSTELVYTLSFGIPVLMILVCELVLWGLMPRQNKDVGLSICPSVTVPHVIRRIYRFLVMFIFGAFSLMLLVDVVKLFVGQLRPNFFNQCRPNCAALGSTRKLTIRNCGERNPLVLKEAMTSFPSLHSAISMYAAITVLVYLHGITRIHHSKFICIPFVGLGFVAFSLCCGLSRLGRNHSWWTDIVVGYLMGAAMAVYLGVFVLRCYDFQETISNRKLNRQLNHVTSLEKNRDAREEEVTSISLMAGLSPAIPRRLPTVRCPASDGLPRARLGSYPTAAACNCRTVVPARVRRTESELLYRY